VHLLTLKSFSSQKSFLLILIINFLHRHTEELLWLIPNSFKIVSTKGGNSKLNPGQMITFTTRLLSR